MSYNVDKNNDELKSGSEKYFGQWETDKVIEKYFPSGHIGKCVDVGAADGRRGSNSFYFENNGWECLCVEANPEHNKSLLELRKNVVMCACGNVDGESNMDLQVFRVGDRDISTSLTSLSPDARLVDDHKHIIREQYSVNVVVKNLTDLVNEFNTDLDFISIDTEGTELDVLKGLDLETINVKLLVVENNYDDADISDYLSQFGYVRKERYKINDFYIKED